MAGGKGSFRGQHFYTVSHGLHVGRRGKLYSLPFEDRGVIGTDVGRQAWDMQISGFVLGENYQADRAALIEAFETPGPGILVHPEYGRKLVEIEPGSVEFKWSTTELRKATLSFRCREARDNTPQTPTVDTGSALQAAADLGRAATAASFEDPTTGLRELVGDFNEASNAAVLASVLQDLRRIDGAVSALLAAPGNIAAKIDEISRTGANLLAAPRRLIDALDGAMDLLAQATGRIYSGTTSVAADTLTAAQAAALNVRRGKALLRAIGPMAELGSGLPDVPDIDTVERQNQLADQRELQRHARASGLFNLARAAADQPFDSANDAEAVRDALVAALVALSETEPSLDQAMASALRATASAVMDHLSAVAGGLGEIATYTPPSALPPEVIAYTLYGDADRAEELVLRNPQVEHPGLMLGREPLEVSTS